MIIDPKQKLKDNLFYNNLILIVMIFCAACFYTYFKIESAVLNQRTYSNLTEDSVYGPIVVKKGHPKICTIKASMHGSNVNVYISGEVQNEERDTLYEFGKELWHEDGYDSEGYWSEADRNISASLAFTEPGTYYIQFNTENGGMSLMQVQLQVKKGSGIPHLMMGTYALILALIAFIMLNKTWVLETLEEINDKLEEMSDD